MCGVAGVVGERHPDLARTMTRSLAHRGPDDEGFFDDGEVSLGVRRLAVVDLETGGQPISGEDGRVTVVFNGEIYNHKELRAELEAKGHRFKTRADTETIVHLYEDLGPQCLSKLRGMFAFAVWDKRDKSLFIARDRLGIKPLYYAERGRALFFASELRALMQAPIETGLDPEAVRLYADLLYVPSPRTLLASARKLEAGAWLRWKDGRLESRRWWRPELRPEAMSERDALDELERRLADSVREQREADVPVGLFLSGGLDSSLLAVQLAKLGNAPTAYTIRTGIAGFDETDKAKAVAEHLGLRHEVVPIDGTFDLDAFLETVDEPLADASMIPTWWVSKACRRSVTVALTGVGGDELFGGYPRYLGARNFQALQSAPKWLIRALAGASSRLPDMASSRNVTSWVRRFFDGLTTGFDEGYRSWIGHAPRRLFRAELLDSGPDPVLAALERAAALGPLERAGQADLETYLPDDLLALADRASMAASLELRVPMLDERLVEFACRLPSELRVGRSELKPLLRRLAARSLPERLAKQPKRGFMAPMGAWLRGELREVVEDALSEASVRRRGCFDPSVVQELKREHFEGRRSRADLLWALTLLELWQRKRLPSAAATAGAPRLRLLVVSDFHFADSEGGSGRVALETARELAKRGHEVTCWGPAPVAGAPAPKETQRHLTLSRAPIGLTPSRPLDWGAWAGAASAHLAAAAKASRPHVLLAHHPRAAWLTEGVEALVKRPRAYFFHSCWSDEYRVDQTAGLQRSLGGSVRERIERGRLARAERVFVLSRFMEDRVLEHGVPADRIRRVPPGVDLERFRPDGRRAEGALTLLTVRNLRARMGLDRLLAALADLQRDRPGAKLVVAGEGPLLAALRDSARELGVESSVEFVGRVPDADLPALYRKADLFVLPSSEHEGLGLVLLEALASGVPAVGTPVGGIPELLERLDPGWISEGLEPREFADAIRRAAPASADPERRAACRRFAEGFRWSAAALEIENALYEIV